MKNKQKRTEKAAIDYGYSVRAIRSTPFCWQEKWVLRVLRKKYSGNMLVKMIALYTTMTWILSDNQEQMLTHYTSTVQRYSGLPKDWIPKGIQELEQLELVTIHDLRNNEGQFNGRMIEFKTSADNQFDIDHEGKKISRTVNRKTDNGNYATLEEASPQNNCREYPTNRLTPFNDFEDQKYCAVVEEVKSVYTEDLDDIITTDLVSTTTSTSLNSGQRYRSGHTLHRSVWEIYKPIFEYAVEHSIFNPRLPDDDGGEYLDVTKEILKSIELFTDIESGKFTENYGQQSTKLQPVQWYEQVITALDEYKRIQNDPKVWPYDKRSLPTSISGWLFNPRSGKSWFIHCLEQKSDVYKEQQEAAVYADVKPEYIAIFKQWFSVWRFAMNDQQESALIRNIHWLIKEHTRIWETAGTYYSKRGNWVSYFGKDDPRLFFERYVEFLREQGGEPHVGKINVSSISYKNFKTWVYNRYEFDLDLTADNVKELTAAKTLIAAGEKPDYVPKLGML